MKRLVEANRSVRRFKQNPAPPTPPACLERLVDLARLTPSANNLQPPLRYVLVQEEGKRDQVFFPAWPGRPT